jgi:RecA/RadA recombinase
MRLKSLNCDFLTDSDISKLNRSNIQTCEQLITYNDIEALSRLTTIPVKNLKLIKKFIIGMNAPFPRVASETLNKYLKNVFIIETGNKQLDEYLLKGIYSSEITEIIGLSSTGKSQMCLNLIVNMFNKYPKFKCLYIDSNNNFCIQRLVQLINYKIDNTDKNKLKQYLEAIQIINCKNIFHLLNILFQVAKPSHTNNLTSQTSSCHLNETNEVTYSPNLIIIDNFTSLFNIFKSNNQFESQFYTSYISSIMKNLCNNMNIILVFTTNIDNEISNNNSYNNIFNEICKNIPNLSIKLTKTNEGERFFEITKCNRNSNKININFKIDQFGIN